MSSSGWLLDKTKDREAKDEAEAENLLCVVLGFVFGECQCHVLEAVDDFLEVVSDPRPEKPRVNWR